MFLRFVFKHFSLSKQVAQLKSKGVMIGTRHKDGRKVYLYMIKDFFANYAMRSSSVEIDLNDGSLTILDPVREPWKITLVDTGESTMTGGRIKRARGF